MQIDLYKSVFNSYFNSPEVIGQIKQSVSLTKDKKKVFFLGNGGSNSICSHMMEDFAKICGYQTYAFSDPAYLTCYANDYGYERAFAEWLKIYFEKGDLLVAISSSGNSLNILNAVEIAKEREGDIITLSGFKKDNKLVDIGNVNFHIPIENYGVVECFHQVILHAVLDELALIRKK